MPNDLPKDFVQELNAVPFFEAAVIQKLQTFDPDGQRGLINRLVTLYLDSAPTTFAQLEQFATNEEFESLRKEAHRFKTSNANLGLLKMAKLLEKLEDSCSPERNNSQTPPALDVPLIKTITQQVLSEGKLAIETLRPFLTTKVNV